MVSFDVVFFTNIPVELAKKVNLLNEDDTLCSCTTMDDIEITLNFCL